MGASPLICIDFYKADHRRQYPAGTEYVYSNFTPRSAKLAPFPKGFEIDGVIVAGIQLFVEDFFVRFWNSNFFNLDKNAVVEEYKNRMDKALGPDSIPVDHIKDLWDLGYLPIHIKALPEGTLCPIGVPMLTIVNTDPRFFWLTNYLESALSNGLWKASTSATIAFHYRRLLESFCDRTGGDKSFVQWQAHDFSLRGMSGMWDAITSGIGHLFSFTGTDTVAAIDAAEEFYSGGIDGEMIGGSVPATEHSVMCMGGKDDEIGTIRRLITEIYPKGIVSVVSDTWDLWKVLTEYLPSLKPEIMAREGKVVIRPDSGNPADILCGDMMALATTPRRKGALQLLWEEFGGTINDKGFKVLDPHVGLIYGDSITLERAYDILSRMEKAGFASTNVVFGIGSYTYEYVTRDTFGLAMKATWGMVNGVPRNLQKDPVTDNGTKRSATGLLSVIRDPVSGKIELKQDCSRQEEEDGLLQTVFFNGVAINHETLGQIRARVTSNLPRPVAPNDDHLI
jgi:nicotinamide phosphoribosyltransferase